MSRLRIDVARLMNMSYRDANVAYGMFCAVKRAPNESDMLTLDFFRGESHLAPVVSADSNAKQQSRREIGVGLHLGIGGLLDQRMTLPLYTQF